MEDWDAKDIESVTVLKDATATEAYGSAGKDGVILIVTKSGKGGKRLEGKSENDKKKVEFKAKPAN